MTIQIKRLTLGMVQTNCYIVADDAARAAVVIDPVDDAPLIHQVAMEAGWTIQQVIATHGHFDHVLASRELKALTGAPFLIHANDVPFLEALPQTGLRFTDQLFPEAARPDRLLTDASETLTTGPIQLETLFTPGHSPGHVALFLRAENVLFAGDALFAGSIGRTDLPGGNYQQLMQSIFDVLLPLGDEVVVLPGHGPQTALGHERATNPFLLEYAGD